MKINLLFFGQAADMTGMASRVFSGISNTRELNEKLIEIYPALQTIKYSIALNRKIVRENTELKNEDTVAILPPFSGG